MVKISLALHEVAITDAVQGAFCYQNSKRFTSLPTAINDCIFYKCKSELTKFIDDKCSSSHLKENERFSNSFPIKLFLLTSQDSHKVSCWCVVFFVQLSFD